MNTAKIITEEITSFFNNEKIHNEKYVLVDIGKNIISEKEPLPRFAVWKLNDGTFIESGNNEQYLREKYDIQL